MAMTNRLPRITASRHCPERKLEKVFSARRRISITRSAIPGAGAVISALTGSLLGASVLIKNSIGVGCLVILLLLCAVPVIKLLLFMFSFYLCSAFLQPVSDKRLMGLLFAAGESAKLFLQALVACFTLFFITIALAAISTNMRYYAG